MNVTTSKSKVLVSRRVQVLVVQHWHDRGRTEGCIGVEVFVPDNE